MKHVKKYHYPFLLALISIATLFLGMILGMLLTSEAWFIFIIMSFLLAIIAFIYSIFLITKDIFKKNRILKNYIANITTIILTGMITFFITGFFKISRGPASRQVCGTKLSGLGKAIMTYAHENKEIFPEPNKWCDLLILYADVTPRIYICDMSDAVIGESSYAMNINLKGKKINQADPNTVVLFDTIYGKDTNGRGVTVSKRYSYKILKEKGEDVGFFGDNPEKQKVYKNRWNQAGGTEMLSAENHKGEGANILFADGCVRYIEKEDFNNLYWGTEPSDFD